MLAGLTQAKSVDYFCLKCSLILVEPVLLPCQHRFCLICINESIEANTLCCPHCLKRFGSWLRLKNASKNTNELVDTSLWSTIKERFNDLLLKRTQAKSSEQPKTSALRLLPKLITNAVATVPFATNASEACNTSWTIMKPIASMQSVRQRTTRIAAAREKDSINIEMTHFRPIRVMPISIVRSYVLPSFHTYITSLIVNL